MRRMFLASTAALISVSLGTARVGAEPFHDLDFETPTPGPATPFLIVPWMAHIGSGYSVNAVFRNQIALDSANVTLIDSSSHGWQPIEGKYSLFDSISFSPEPVPEPASIVLALVGFAGLLVMRWLLAAGLQFGLRQHNITTHGAPP